MRKFLGLAPVLLLAGCHSAQVVSQSQPAAAELIVAGAPVLAADPALTAVVVAPRPATATLAAPAPAVASALPNRPARPPRPAERVRALSRLAATTIAQPAARRLAHRWQRQRPTEGAAENGLGRVALFFIGVVLAVLAGLAALISLIPGVSFWGGLGLAVAGLLVIFLLYSLFSGGKK